VELAWSAVAAAPDAASIAGLKASVSASSAASCMPLTISRSAAETAARLLWSMEVKRALAWASAVPAFPDEIWKVL
jgi:hypothetical protein